MKNRAAATLRGGNSNNFHAIRFLLVCCNTVRSGNFSARYGANINLLIVDVVINHSTEESELSAVIFIFIFLDLNK